MKTRHIAVIIMAGAALRLAVAFQPPEYHLSRGPLVDDAFYSLNIARRAATDNGYSFDGITPIIGFTFDGQNPTNGFQPLYVYLMVPVYRLFPDNLNLPVLVALTMLALFSSATGLLIFLIARLRAGPRAAAFALALFTFSPYIIEQGLNGLETSIAGFFWMLALYIYLARVRPGSGKFLDHFGLGAALFLLVLARVDGAFLAAAIAADSLLLNRQFPFRRRLSLTAGFAGFALIFYIFWAFTEIGTYGRLIPSSGAAVRFLSLRPALAAASATGPPFTLAGAPPAFYFYCFKQTLAALAGTPLFFPFSTITALIKPTGLDFTALWPLTLPLIAGGLVFARRAAGRGLDSIVIAIALMLIAYTTYSLGFWFYPRYYYPVILCLIVISAPVIEFILQKLSANAQRIFLIVVGLIYLILFAVQARQTFAPDRDRDIGHYYAAARAVAATTEPDAAVGAFQAGVIGYYSGRRVINLDGVVNERMISVLREKRLLSYLERNAIQYVVIFPAHGDDFHLAESLGPGEESYFTPITRPDSDFIIFQVRRP